MNAAPSPTDHFHQVLASRRMCRDFLAEEIADDTFEFVTRSAFRGPSAGNTAGLDLVVLRGDDIERYWRVALPEPRRTTFRWPGLLNAPVLVIPVVDPAAYVQRYQLPDKTHADLGDGESAWTVPYWFVDGGAAVMAMLLAAEASSLGALFFGQFDNETAISTEFGVPDGRRSLGTLALGHAAPSGRNPSASAHSGRPDPVAFIHTGSW